MAERATRRSKLTRVTVCCAACLGLHACTVSYLSYLNWEQQDSSGSLSPAQNTVWETAVFLIPLSYEVFGALAFLYVTRQRRGAGAASGA